MSTVPATEPPLEVTTGAPVPRMSPSRLRGLERIAVPLVTLTNTTWWMKDAIQLFVRHVSCRWTTLITRNLWDLHGLEHVRDLRPPRGVILVSNHRSFFDMYVASAVLYREARFMRRLYFPVRATYFYDRPMGLFLNLAISGGAMWPPVFRDDRRADLNPVGLQQMRWILDHPGTVLGMHPEGTRCKSPDPYATLEPKPGIGQLVQAAHPDTLLLPFFVAGLTNDLLAHVRRNFGPASRRGPGIRITFGPAVRAGDFDRAQRAAVLARDVMALVHGLGEQDRARLSGGAGAGAPAAVPTF